MSDKVSIILPVYNVERYLPQCIQSIIEQTFSEIEIILVDDGSTDRSPLICDTFAERDDRIKVIHQTNGGAAKARNTGMDNSTGDYIMFIDSDDWIEKNTVKELLTLLKTSQCDIVMCQFIDEYVNGNEKHNYIDKEGVFSNVDIARKMLMRWEYLISCCKLYRREVLENVRWVEGHCIDDEFFTYKAIINANRIRLCRNYLYHYRQRKSSAMGNEKKKFERLRDQIDFVILRYDELCSAFPKLKASITEHLLMVLFHVMQNGRENSDIFFYAKRMLKKYGFKSLFNIRISVSIKKSIVKYMLTKRTNIILSTKNTDNKSDWLYFE